jgi:hypothetical protein
MKSIKLKGLLMIGFTILVSACVSQKEFDKHVAEYKAELDRAQKVESILLCESRNDAYQDMMASDEPNPTRRDEPNPTRRDQACQDEFDAITNGNVQACKADMITCVAPLADGGAELPTPQCRACYTTCLSTGTWDGMSCPLP